MFLDSGQRIKCVYENVIGIKSPKVLNELRENKRIMTGDKTLRTVQGSPVAMLFDRNSMKFCDGTIVSVTPIEYEGDLLRLEFKNYVGKKTCFPLMHPDTLIMCKEIPDNPNDVVWMPFITKKVSEVLEGNYCLPDIGPENSMPYGSNIIYYRRHNMNVTRIPITSTIYEVECEPGFSYVMEDTFLRALDMESARMLTGNKSEYKGEE